MVLISIALLSVGSVFLADGLFSNEKTYDYMSTDFIEPERSFITCSNVDDCFKFKGSACPAEVGGIEVCINKDFVQEYTSIIENKTGLQIEIECPQVDVSTDMACSCIENKCLLVGESV